MRRTPASLPILGRSKQADSVELREGAMEGMWEGVWELPRPGAMEGVSVWSSVWPNMLWLRWHLAASPPTHTHILSRLKP